MYHFFSEHGVVCTASLLSISSITTYVVRTAHQSGLLVRSRQISDSLMYYLMLAKYNEHFT